MAQHHVVPVTNHTVETLQYSQGLWELWGFKWALIITDVEGQTTWHELGQVDIYCFTKENMTLDGSSLDCYIAAVLEDLC